MVSRYSTKPGNNRKLFWLKIIFNLKSTNNSLAASFTRNRILFFFTVSFNTNAYITQSIANIVFFFLAEFNPSNDNFKIYILPRAFPLYISFSSRLFQPSVPQYYIRILSPRLFIKKNVIVLSHNAPATSSSVDFIPAATFFFLFLFILGAYIFSQYSRPRI